MPTTIHHIALTKTSLNLSGGEKAEIELIDYFDREGFKNVVYTSETGKILFKQLKGFEKVDFVVVGPYWVEKINAFLAYYLRFIQLFFHLRRFPKGRHVMITHDNFVPSSLYSLLLHWLNPRAKWILIYHMKCPSLFRGFLGEFTDTFSWPSLRLMRYWLEERTTFMITKGVHKVVTVNPFNLKFLGNFYPQKKLYALDHFGGIDIPVPKELNKNKEYDLVFVGRFHPQKGIFDLIEVIKQCKKSIPAIKLVVLGGGDAAYEEQFKAELVKEGLDQNILYQGYISGQEKYDYIQKSKLFVLPSYFESFPVVFMESMSLGIPFVAYALPVYAPLKEGVARVAIGDKQAMADAIVRLLGDSKELSQLSAKAKEFAGEFSWERTGEEFKTIITNLG